MLRKKGFQSLSGARKQPIFIEAFTEIGMADKSALQGINDRTGLKILQDDQNVITISSITNHSDQAN